jgi:hypothetical protein
MWALGLAVESEKERAGLALALAPVEMTCGNKSQVPTHHSQLPSLLSSACGDVEMISNFTSLIIS